MTNDLNLKGKKLLLMGGSRNMKEILDVAQAQGIWVGVTDWYDTKRSPIKLIADEYFDASIENYDEIRKIITSNSYDGLLTGYTDSYLVHYANICEMLNLPCYGTKEQFKTLADKSCYKKLFTKYNVPTLPVYLGVEINNEFHQYPILLKPTKGSGGRGLIKINNYEEYVKVCADSEDGEIDRQYIIEPYLEQRRELTAFFLFVNGEIFLTGTANRFLSKAQGNKIALPILYSMPSSYEEAFQKFTAEALVKMFAELKLQNGMVFAQCIMHDGVPKVYDLGFRLTGTFEYKLQEKMYGFNVLKMMINHSLTGDMFYVGMNPVNIFPEKISKYGFNITILGKEGTITKINGSKEILEIPQVLDCSFQLLEGDTIENYMIGTLSQIIVRIFFIADTLGEAEMVISDIYSKLTVLDQNQKDMILDRMYTKQLLKEYGY